MAFDEGEQLQQTATSFSLEECLNLSQKFLKEMSKEETNAATGDSSKLEGRMGVVVNLVYYFRFNPTLSLGLGFGSFFAASLFKMLSFIFC